MSDAIFVWPGDTGPGTVPPAWDSPSDARTDVNLELLECQHISWGPFERGPVQFLFELHDKGLVPPDCFQNRPDQVWNLERVMVSDPEIVQFLHTEYNLTADLAKFNVNTMAAGPSKLFTWEWTPANGVASHISVGQSSAVTSPYASTERYIAMSGPGLVLLDMTYHYTNSIQFAVVPGEMHAPMLYAQAMPNGAYLGTGDAGTDFQATAKIVKFGDELCKQRIS